MAELEAWLRGPIEGVDPMLMPVAHAFTQAKEDIARLARSVAADAAHRRAAGAASVAFHVHHAAGSLDRLLTYARGEALSPTQLAALAAEHTIEEAAESLETIGAAAIAALDRGIAQVRATPRTVLLEPRAVGRAQLPSTVLGLLVHAAEHTTRHLGQAITTAKILAG